MTSKYSKGSNFERDVVAFLAENNHFAARLAGSKSKHFGGVVDIIAYDKTLKLWLLIQAKKDGYISLSDKQTLMVVAEECGATPLLAHKEEGKIKLTLLKEDK